MTQLRAIQANPALAGASFNDPRMISVLGVLMGIDMEGFAREPGSDELPPSLAKNSTPPSSAPKPSTSQPAPQAQPPKEEDVKMEEPEEEDEEAIAKKQALAEKARGNESYKKREFESAIESFKKAWDLWPKDITFLTNMAGTSPWVQLFDLILTRD
jgi:stress-induced-phosphoprotein 1